jgi:Uma2 family endonuclease
MGIPVIDTGPMTVAEFYAFTDRRPDGEKWELVKGQAVLQASPSRFHQLIVRNVIFALVSEERRLGASWRAIPGVGALVSDTNRPEPDIMVVPKDVLLADPCKRDTRDAIVLFEIMSPSTASQDLKWKRAAYATLPALTHYVVVAQEAVDVVVFGRATGFAEQRYRSLTDTLEFSDLGAALPLAEIYRELDLT